MTKKRSSSADLGARDETLTLLPWTEEERVAMEHKASRTAASYLGPGQELQDVLEMLGVLEYPRAKKARNNTPILHGRRSGYTNRGCRCPECVEANNAYYRELRQRTAA